MGKREVQIIQIGRSHTAGDTVVWLPQEKVCFAGDVVEFGATPYCGDAHFTDWPATLAALKALGAEKLVPGRGRSLLSLKDVEEGIAGTAAFTSDLFGIAKAGAAKGATLKQVYDEAMGAMRPKYGHWVIFEHCMPFNVSRAYDEAKGLDHPRIWTAERDVEMWKSLEHGAAAKSADTWPKGCVPRSLNRRAMHGKSSGMTIVQPMTTARGGTAAPGYMPGFGNEFETEALPGALPIGQNSPQRCAYGLYAEQLSGSPFTAPRGTNERSWLYRIRPTVAHGALPEIDVGLWRTAPRAEVEMPIGQLRWDPIPIPDEACHFSTGVRTITTAGDAHAGRHGGAPLSRDALDGGRVFLQRRWRDAVRAAAGRAAVLHGVRHHRHRPGEIAVIPRGVKFRVELPDGPARGYICENYGGEFTLPERGPIGANCLANPRDFLTPVAAYRGQGRACRLNVKWGGTLLGHGARSLAARRRRLARQLRALQIRPAPFLSGRRRCCSTMPTRRSSPC